MSLKDSALSCADKGWPVFPLKVGKKKPATPNGFKNAQTEPSAVQALWRNPDYNVGIATGSGAGFYVLDIDVSPETKEKMANLRDAVIEGPDLFEKARGEAAATKAALEAKIGALPKTYTVRTATGGLHLYFRMPEDGSAIGSLTGLGGLSIDVRGDGGYVVAPPSIHPNGLPYELEAEVDIRPAPNLAEYIISRQGKGKGRAANKNAAPSSWRDGTPKGVLTVLLGFLRKRFGLDEDQLDHWGRVIAPDLKPEEVRTIAGKAAGGAAEIGATGTFMVEGRRDDGLAAVCGKMREHWGWDEDQMTPYALAIGRAATPHAMDDGEIMKVVRSITGYPADTTPKNDIELSQYLAQRLEPNFRSTGKDKAKPGWIRWDGRRWAGSGDLEVQNVVGQELLALQNAAADPDAKFASSYKVRAMTGHVPSDPCLRADPSQFDADARYLNLMNGVLDLKDCSLIQHDRDLLLTKLASVSYDPEAACPLFDSFLARVQPDPEVRRYIARVMGYALLGDPVEQKFFVLPGEGSNGKSTLMETLNNMFGPYAGTVGTEAFLRGSSPERASKAMHHLPGVRVAVTAELSRNQMLEPSLVKRLSGGEEITGKKLYSDEFNFKPQFTVFMSTNATPAFDGADRAMARRIVSIPWGVTIPEAERDEKLRDRLEAEWPGILNWVLAGLRDYRSQKLAPPQAIQDATNKLIRDRDLIQRFIDDCFEVKAGGRVTRAAVNNTYRFWCSDQNCKALSSKDLETELAKKGIQCRKTGGEHTYFGICQPGAAGIRLAG